MSDLLPLEFGGREGGAGRRWRITTNAHGRRILECFCGGDWDNADRWIEYADYLPPFNTEDFENDMRHSLPEMLFQLYDAMVTKGSVR